MKRLFHFSTWVAAIGLMMSGTALAQTEWEERSSHYEDDAWYDITEWFDGNDYNPVNERPGDQDNDVAGTDSDSWFGFDDRNQNDNWFYDYYDDDYRTYGEAYENRYGYVYGYRDLDNDGIYDESYHVGDLDNDGNYAGLYTRSDSAEDRNRGEQSQFGMQAHTVSGTVKQVKTVTVRDAKHQLVQIQATGGEKRFVDLGRKEALEDVQMNDGTQIEITGPAARVGDAAIILAQELKIDGQSHEIDRHRGELSGEIVSTRKVDVRGQKHMLAMVKVNGKKRAVDLGAAEDLNDLTLEQGETLTVFGPRVKVEDHTIVMAHKVEQNGSSLQIDRQQSEQNQDAASTS